MSKLNSKEWVIDPATTRVIVLSHDHYLRAELATYVYNHFPIANVLYNFTDEQLVIARNRAMVDLCVNAPEQYTDFVLFDNDMIPDYRLDGMFTVQADLVGAQYDTPTPNAWLRPDDVHCGAMRFSRAALMRINPPYFAFEYDGPLMRCLKCECLKFRDSILSSGGSVVRSGWVGNQNDRSWCRSG